MSKLTRFYHKIFGISANFSLDMGRFGSLKAGSPTFAADAEDAQSLSAWESGLADSVTGNNSPCLEDMNSAFHVTSRQVGYLFQEGIPEWDASTAYYVGSMVNVAGEIFKSISDVNVGQTTVSNPTKWESKDKPLADYLAAISGQIIPYAGLAAPTGFLFCDGSELSRSTYSTLFNITSEATTVSVTIATPGVVTWNAHGFKIGDQVNFTTTGALPTGLTANTVYFVCYASLGTNSFTLASTLAFAQSGAAITTSGSQSGVHTMRHYRFGGGNGTTTFNLPSASFFDGYKNIKHTAVITAAGAIENKTSDWINSVGLSGTARYLINYSKLGLFNVPALEGTACDDAGSGGSLVEIGGYIAAPTREQAYLVVMTTTSEAAKRFSVTLTPLGTDTDSPQRRYVIKY